MQAKKIGALAVLLTAAFAALHLAVAAEPARESGARDGQAVSIDNHKIQEAEVKARLEEPNFGYVGDIGTFVVTTKNAAGREAHADFVVHAYPDQDRVGLGCTKLKYDGAKRLGNVDGWVFTTEWDGKMYPSKVFVSAQRVYFGGGRQDYIAADYRTETGWTWKMIPLRRLPLAGKDGPEASR
jgi:hypothetical protein